MVVVTWWPHRPFSKALKGERLSQLKRQSGKVWLSGLGMLFGAHNRCGDAKASEDCGYRSRTGQSHQHTELSKGRGGTVEKVRFQPTLVLVTESHSST